jgi:hypothetical protein
LFGSGSEEEFVEVRKLFTIDYDLLVVSDIPDDAMTLPPVMAQRLGPIGGEDEQEIREAQRRSAGKRAGPIMAADRSYISWLSFIVRRGHAPARLARGRLAHNPALGVIVNRSADDEPHAPFGFLKIPANSMQ